MEGICLPRDRNEAVRNHLSSGIQAYRNVQMHMHHGLLGRQDVHLWRLGGTDLHLRYSIAMPIVLIGHADTNHT